MLVSFDYFFASSWFLVWWMIFYCNQDIFALPSETQILFKSSVSASFLWHCSGREGGGQFIIIVKWWLKSNFPPILHLHKKESSSLLLGGLSYCEVLTFHQGSSDTTQETGEGMDVLLLLGGSGNLVSLVGLHWHWGLE